MPHRPHKTATRGGARVVAALLLVCVGAGANAVTIRAGSHQAAAGPITASGLGQLASGLSEPDKGLTVAPVVGLGESGEKPYPLSGDGGGESAHVHGDITLGAPQHSAGDHTAAIVDLPRADNDGTSSAGTVTDLLEALVNVTPGSPAAAGQGRDPGGPRGERRNDNDPLAGIARSLVIGLLSRALTAQSLLDGRVMFSVLGQGAFVLESTTDGSTVTLSELGSGARVQWGREPSLPGHAEAALPAASLALGNESFEDSAVFSVMHGLAGILQSALGLLKWLATSPAAILLLLPVLLAVTVVSGLLRNPRGDDPSRAAARPLDEPGASRQSARTGAGRSRRRRSRRRRGSLRGMLRSVVESLGFPAAEQVHEALPGLSTRRSSRTRRRSRHKPRWWLLRFRSH